MRRFLFILDILLIITILQSCKSSKDTSVGQRYARKPITEVKADDLKIDALAIDAKTNIELGHYEEAIALYQTIIRQRPTYSVAYYELGNLYFAQGHVELAIAYTKKADEIAKNNEWYKLQLAELYKKTYQTTELIKVYTELIEQHPSVLEYHYELGNAYIMCGKVRESIAVFDNVEKMVGVTEPVSLQKQKLWNAIGEKEKGMAEIEKLAKEYPQERRYNAILAEQCMEQKKYPKALEYYNKVLAADTTDEYIHISLAEYYKAIGDSENAYKELKKGFLNPKLNIRSKRQILGSFYSSEEFYTTKSQYAFDLAETLISNDPDSASYAVFYGDILMRKGKYGRAANCFRNYLETDSTESEVWQALIQCDSELDNDSLLLSDASRAIEIFPTDPIFYYFKGFILGKNEYYNEAITILEKALNCGFSDQNLQYSIYVTLADFYHEINNHENSDLYYEKYLERHPDDVLVLNNYAYFLAERSEKLDKALEMSKKTIDKDPLNSTFLDTYAWILHKNGNDTEAEIYIEKALKNSNYESATLYSHYALILKALDKIDAAKKASAKYIELKAKESETNYE